MDPIFPGLTLKVRATHKNQPNGPNPTHHLAFFLDQPASVCASVHVCEYHKQKRKYSYNISRETTLK